METKNIVLEVADFLESKKAGSVTVIDIGKNTSIADYFIIADGDVQLQLDSLSTQVRKHLSKQGLKPRNIRYEATGGWALLDYSDFVIHLFLKETREFYKLESIWGECEFVRQAG